MLLHQPGHFLGNTKAMDVATDGCAICVDNLLAIDVLLFRSDTCRSQGADPHRVIHDLVVSSLGRGKVLWQVLIRLTEDL